MGREARSGQVSGGERRQGAGRVSKCGWPSLPQPTPSCGHSPNVASSRDGMDNETGTESLVSHRRERARRRNREEGNEAAP